MAINLRSLSRKLEGPAYAALRMVAGAAFSFHGMQKILGWLAHGKQPPIGSQIWFGGII